MRRISIFAISALVYSSLFPRPVFPLNLDRLDAEELRLRESVMRRLVPLADRRKQEGTAPLITFEELYTGLGQREVAFLEQFRRVDPEQVGGSSRRLPAPAADTEFVRLKDQAILRDGKRIRLDTQYLPLAAHGAYRRMMAAMEQDLGKRLLVESGYRSPAYQLYLFLYYMPKHGHSIRETNRHVALPGCSEHGSPDFQAIDFITPEGVNGEDRPEEFEELQEYGWLRARAQEFGFRLSYPRGGPSAFEPWHWHWEEN
jgi:D-alanyl-D-alanine carboxypeptidase